MERVCARKVFSVVAAVLFVVLLAACGGESAVNAPSPDPQPDQEPTNPGGTYTDPGTPPPAPIAEPTIMTSGAISVSDKVQGLITLNIAGFSVDDVEGLNTAALGPVLDVDDFTVVEGGVVQGISVSTVDTGDNVPADIVFVIDTTDTMKNALESVKDGIISFGSALESSGLDVRLGAVTFGDAFDTLAVGSRRSGVSLINKTPPGFDDEERPSFPLTDDLLSFQAFIAEETPRNGEDLLENSLGALTFAYRNFEWRDGAQRILVVVTDTCSHSEANNYYIPEPWAPEKFENVLNELRGKATVHVIGTGNSCSRLGGLNMNVFTGVEGTGGMFHKWNGGEFNLADIGLTPTMTNNYLITYKGELDGKAKEIRLVIDDGETLKGDFTLKATY